MTTRSRSVKGLIKQYQKTHLVNSSFPTNILLCHGRNHCHNANIPETLYEKSVMIDRNPRCDPDIIFNLRDENIIEKLPPNHFTFILAHYGAAYDILYQKEDPQYYKTYFKQLRNKIVFHQDRKNNLFLSMKKDAMARHRLKRKPLSFAPYIKISEFFSNNLFYLGSQGCVYVLTHLYLETFSKEDQELIPIYILEQFKKVGFSHAFMFNDIENEDIDNDTKKFIKFMVLSFTVSKKTRIDFDNKLILIK